MGFLLDQLGGYGADQPRTRTNRDGFVSSIKRSGAMMVGGAGELYADITGDEEHDNALTRFDDRVQANNPSEINSLEDIADNPWLATKVAAGNAVGFLGPGLVGKGLGYAGAGLKMARVAQAGNAINSFGAQTALMGLPSLRAIGEDQRASGEEPNDLLKYGAAGAVGAVENLFGVQKMLGIGRGASKLTAAQLERQAIGEMGKTPWRTAGKTFGQMVLGEGGEELIQSPIEQYAGFKDPTTSESVDETLFGGAMGALGGATFGLLGGGRQGLRHKGIRDDLQEEGFIRPGEGAPTDLLRGTDTKEQYNYVQGNYDAQTEFDRPAPEQETDPEAQAYLQEQETGAKKQRLVALLVSGGRTEEDAIARVESAFAPKKPKDVGAVEDVAMREQLAAEGMSKRQIETLLKDNKAVPTGAPAVPKVTARTQLQSELDTRLAKGLLTPEQHADFTADVNNAEIKPSIIRNAVAKQSFQGPPNAPKTAKAALPAVPKEAQPAVTLPPEVAPPTAPKTTAELPAYKAEMSKWLTSALDTNELQAMVMVHGANKDSGGDPEIAGHSLRAAAATTNFNTATGARPVSHTQIATYAANATAKIEAAAAKAGLDLDTAKEIMGMASSYDMADIANEAGWEGTTRTQVTRDQGEFEDTAGMEREEATLGDVTVENGKVKDEVAYDGAEAEGFDADVAEYDADTTMSEVDQEDIARALPYWEEQDGYPLPKQFHKRWAAVIRRAEEGKINERQYLEAYAELAADVVLAESEGQSRGVGSQAESAAPEKAAGNAAGSTAVPEGKPAAKVKKAKAVRKTPAAPVVEEPTIQEKQKEILDAAKAAHETEMADAFTARIAAIKDGLGEKQQARVDKLAARLQNGEIDETRFADEVALVNEQKAKGIQYSVAETPLQKVISAWKQVVANVFAGGVAATESPVVFPSTPAALQVLGLGDREVRISVKHGVEDALFDHGIKKSQLESLPAQLADPVAIYFTRSQDGRPSLNIVTDTFTTGKRVVVTLHPEKSGVGSGPVHFVATTVARGDGAVMAAARNGDFMYVGNLPASIKAALAEGTKKHGQSAIDLKALLLPTNKFGETTRAGRIQTRADAVKMVSSGKAQYSNASATDNPTNAQLVTNALKGWFFTATGLNKVVTVVDSVAQLPQAVQDALGKNSRTDTGVQAFVHEGRVYMIAGNIESGKELAVFLHEAGAHLGMEKLLGKESYDKLKSQVSKWHGAKGLEGDIARRAMNRTMDADEAALARGEDAMTPSEAGDELLAYFVEEAVNAGVDPTALHKTTGPMQQWFRTMLAAMKTALRKMGLQRFDKLTAQDLVNLAYGAAKLELDGAQVGASRESDKIKFSRAPGAATLPELKQDTEKLTKGFMDRLKSDAMDLTNKALDKVMFTHDLINRATKQGLKSAAAYKLALDQRDAIKNRHEKAVDQIMQRAADLSDKDAVKVLLKRATMDRDKTWKTSKDYLALSEKGRKVAAEIFAHGESTSKEIKRLMLAETNSEWDSMVKRFPQKTATYNKKRAADIRRIERVMPMDGGPYAPLKRFGDYVVVARSQAYKDAEANSDDALMEKLIKGDGKQVHYVVEFFDSKGRADERKAQLEKDRAGWFADISSSTRQMQYSQIDQLPWTGIAKVKAAAEGDPDMAGKEGMQRLLTDLYLQMLAESSARKSEMGRGGEGRGVEGAGDMFRAFASQGRSMAHFVANLEKAPEISRRITAMRGEARADKALNSTLNEINARHAQGLDYKDTPWADKAMRATSGWMLMTSPAYYLTNAMQTYMVALPILGGKYGGKAFTEMNKAYAEILPLVKKMGHDINAADFGKTDAERAMIQHMLDTGRIDITQAADLGRWAEGTANRGPVSKVMDKFSKIFMQVEATNRLSTALTAFRLSGSVEYAASVIDDAQGNYAANNAPRFFHANGAAKLITQFRKYQLIQISLISKLVHDSFKGGTAGERLVARKTLAWLLTQQMITTGVKGLPIPAVLLAAAGAGLGDDDKDWERNLRKEIGDDDVADLLIRGVPASLGLDISGRVGMGNAFSILPYTDMSVSKKGFKEAAFGFLGPWAAQGANMLDGAEKIADGKYYKGVEMLLPSGLRNAMAGFRMATDGITNNRSDQLLAPDEVSFLAGLSKAIGLPTTTTTDSTRQRNDVFELDKHFSDQDKDLKDKYAEAARAKDTGEMADIRKEWLEHQEAKKGWAEEMKRQGLGHKDLVRGLKPQPLSTLLRAPQAQVKREKPWQSAGAN